MTNEQVSSKVAWFYRKYQNELILDDRLNYLHAEEGAHAAKVGLWLDADPVAPWDFRRASKQ